MTSQEITKVIFRVFQDKSKDVIALFPQDAGDNRSDTCSSYMHYGQHGVASVGLVHCTKLATPEEYTSLKEELERIGYKLKIGKRFSYSDYLKRVDQISK